MIEIDDDTYERHVRELPEIDAAVQKSYAVFRDAVNEKRLSGPGMAFALSRLLHAIVTGIPGVSLEGARTALKAITTSAEACLEKHPPKPKPSATNDNEGTTP